MLEYKNANNKQLTKATDNNKTPKFKYSLAKSIVDIDLAITTLVCSFKLLALNDTHLKKTIFGATIIYLLENFRRTAMKKQSKQKQQQHQSN